VVLLTLVLPTQEKERKKKGEALRPSNRTTECLKIGSPLRLWYDFGGRWRGLGQKEWGEGIREEDNVCLERREERRLSQTKAVSQTEEGRRQSRSRQRQTVTDSEQTVNRQI
jgi:hypothetical protein